MKSNIFWDKHYYCIHILYTVAPISQIQNEYNARDNKLLEFSKHEMRKDEVHWSGCLKVSIEDPEIGHHFQYTIHIILLYACTMHNNEPGNLISKLFKENDKIENIMHNLIFNCNFWIVSVYMYVCPATIY